MRSLFTLLFSCLLFIQVQHAKTPSLDEDLTIPNLTLSSTQNIIIQMVGGGTSTQWSVTDSGGNNVAYAGGSASGNQIIFGSQQFTYNLNAGESYTLHLTITGALGNLQIIAPDNNVLVNESGVTSGSIPFTVPGDGGGGGGSSCDAAITSVDKTDASCSGVDDGTITINATCIMLVQILL